MKYLSLMGMEQLFYWVAQINDMYLNMIINESHYIKRKIGDS